MNETKTDMQPDTGPAIPRQPQPPEPTCSIRLSEKDEAAVLAAADNPPAPNEAAVRAAKRFVQRHG